MIHHELLQHIKSVRGTNGFIHPYYGKYSIAEIVPTIEALLRAKPGSRDRPMLPRELWGRNDRTKRVVLFLVDGFAFEHLARYYPSSAFLSRLVTKGDVYPITSVFPSTTPAALTTIHSGVTPQEHGLPEWTVFFEEMDAVIETLPFRVLMSGGRDTLLETGGSASMLYDGPTIYSELAEAGVPSFTFGYFEYANGAYSRATQKGANDVSYLNIMDLCGKLREHLARMQGPAYFFVYWGNVDAVMHKYGPHTKEHLAELAFFADTIEKELLCKLDPRDAADTLFMMTADHGQVNVQSERIIYLNQYLDLEAWYQHSKKKKVIVPTGGPHDVFLFVSPSKVNDTLALLRRELDGKAEILRTEEAVASGLFGMGTPSERFLRRVGNVLILPRRGHHVWYEHLPDAPFRQLGCHGGLSEEEMIVPLAIAKLEDLLPGPCPPASSG